MLRVLFVLSDSQLLELDKQGLILNELVPLFVILLIVFIELFQ